MQNIITRKIKYSVSQDEKQIILNYIKNYNNALRFTYNRLRENPNLKTREISAMHRQLSNIFIGTHFLGSAIFDAKKMLKTSNEKPIIFGGRYLFNQRQKGRISREEWQRKRLVPLFNVGRANTKGNNKFQIVNHSIVLFKPTKDIHINLHLQKLTRKTTKELEVLINLQESKSIPITYRLDLEYIYISYDYNVMREFFHPSDKIKNRTLSLDINPNYIGYSVSDWEDEDNYHLIEKSIYSLKPLNDIILNLHEANTSKKFKHWNNKLKHEIIVIAQKLSRLANHYKCEIIGMEDLNMQTKDSRKGKIYNRLVTQLWNRRLFTQQLKKYAILYNIQLIEVNAAYSSFIGNLSYRKECAPDMVLASIEIGRRALEFYHQYILKDISIKKNIITPTSKIQIRRIKQSLEELNYSTEFENLRSLYSLITKEDPKQRYRVSLETIDSSSYSRKFYYRQKVILYKF